MKTLLSTLLIITSLLGQLTLCSIAAAASSFPYDILFLASEPDANHYALWGSNGNEAGTQVIKDINPTSGLDLNRVRGFYKAGSWLLFAANDGVNGWELWRTDGTTDGTRMLKDIDGLPYSTQQCTYGDYGCEAPMCGGCPGFSCNGDPMCQMQYDMMCSFPGGCFCDATRCTTESGSTDIGGFISNGTKVFFQVSTNHLGGFDLWVSDGTEVGTTKIKDFVNFHDWGFVGDTLFLGADDGTNRGLWVSDGTTAGTVFVKSIGDPDSFDFGRSATYLPFGDKLMFSWPWFYGDVWVSDGTEPGTYEIMPQPVPGPIQILQATTPKYGFLLRGAIDNFDLYSMTGTVGDETKLNSGSYDVSWSMTAIGDLLYFFTRSGSDSIGPWVTDGTVLGTRQVGAFNIGAPYSKGFSKGHDGHVFMWTGDHIWAMDSSENITSLLTGEIFGTSWQPRFLADTDKTWLTFYKDGEFGLWVTDGSVGHTARVKEFMVTDNIYLTKLPVAAQPIYSFDGFFQPVDNLPTLNLTNAGRAIPVKFSLGEHKGLDIIAAGYPKSEIIACDLTAPADGIAETVSANSSGLTYDFNSNQYIYIWKTDGSWSSTCRQLVLKLNDGTYHRANFKFIK